jgi:acetyl esterase/lipase
LLPLFLLPRCSPVTIINTLTPRDSFEVTAGIPYGQGARQHLDVYRPKAAAPRAPVVVFFYGGEWRDGSKDLYLFVGEALAAKGFVVVVPDYRLFPDVRYPDFLEDNAAAVRWTVDHISDYGGDPARVSLMGHSAGAYNAAMLALDPRWLGEVALDPRRDIRHVVCLAGPYDFLPLTDPIVNSIFGSPNQWADTQPVNHVDGRAPPMLLATGLSDSVVRPENTRELAARIRDRGGAVETVFYADVSHAELLGAFSVPLRFLAPSLRDTVAFLNGTSAAN